MSEQQPALSAAQGVRKVRQLLGEWLLEHSLVTKDQLDLALDQQKRTRRFLGEVLLYLGFITEETLSGALAAQAGVEHISLEGLDVPPAILDLVPEPIARKHAVLPIAHRGSSLRVAMSNVLDVMAIDAVVKSAKLSVLPLHATRREITAAIDRLYARRDRIEDVFERLIKQAEQRQSALTEDLAAASNAGAIVELVDQIIDHAVGIRATDIHLEPEEQVTRLRFRVDGMLLSGPSLPKVLHAPLAARIKVMAKLNISESRLPQDGKARFETLTKKLLDLRVSTFLTNHGENLVMRVLSRESVVETLDQLGMSPQDHQRFLRMISRPNGIILVTGPTGSGKTTTLYAALAQLNSVEKNIMTIEDPIEYELPLVRQSQINLKAGITFASGLRAILRQDPDIILLGETRDEETAEMAVRAAMTGHLVFTTLHTNSAVGAIPRLVDLKVQPFLIGSSVIGSLAQRLVRLVCKVCRTPSPADVRHAEALERVCDRMGIAPKVYRAVGCPSCRASGFTGRLAIYELIDVAGDVRRLIMDGQCGASLEEAARRQGFPTLYEDGLAKVAQGLTTLSEVERVVEPDLWQAKS